MMIKYRPHKGSLDESLALSKEFSSIHEMKKHIINYWVNFSRNKNIFSVKDIVIDKEVYYDKRCGWNTQYVCVKRMGTRLFDTPQCIGMCEIKK